jgi:dTDP-glucose 4,6-dehydratase
VHGTLALATRDAGGVHRFLQVSTDEVYGGIAQGAPDRPARPPSPYAASKTAADAFVHAYATTFGVPAVITRCSNNYGPYQFPEKLIPLFVTNALDGEPLPLYGDGENVRDWIHVSDHCAALWHVLGLPHVDGRVWNVSAANERPNRAVTETILGPRAAHARSSATSRTGRDTIAATPSTRPPWPPRAGGCSSAGSPPPSSGIARTGRGGSR